MSQKFNFMDFSERGKFMVDLPRNKDAILSRLEQLHAYELKHPRVHLDDGKCKFGWLCDTLIQTYNTSVLDVSDPTFKDACIDQAHKCVSEENREPKREVLSQLILNHSKQDDPEVSKKDKKPIADFIGGPVSLTMHWSKKYKKLIYIFGEYHSEVTDCENFRSKTDQNQVMLIEDYLEQLFKHTDVFIDFYLEADRTYRDVYGVKRIAVINKRFKDCFYNPNKNINDCKLSRMHYFDVRRESPDIKPNRMSHASIEIFNIFIGLFTNTSLQELTILLDKYNYYIKIKPVLEEFSKINIYEDKADDEKYAEYDQFWDTQIKEQIFVLKKVGRSTIHDEIKSFIKKEVRNPEIDSEKIDIKKLIKKVKDFVDTLDKYSTGKTYNLFQSVVTPDDREILLNLSFVAFLISINAHISTDYYLLCRIFKVFDFTKRKNYRWTDEPKEPHNIIIYAGDTHSKTVRKFLKELEFKNISSVNTSTRIRNCIDMRSFPQPLFSNHRKIKWNDELPEEYLVDNKVIELEHDFN